MTLLGSNSEVWDEATFFCPSLCHSSHFSLFILLKLHSLHLPLPCPHTSSLLLPTLLSFHLISPSPPFLIPLHIYSAEQLLICPLVPHTLLHCPLSPCLSIAPLFPSCPFCNSSLFLCGPPPPLLFGEVLSSRLLKRSPFPGQGSTTIHFTHDRVCCMPVMYIYAASGGATDG